MPRRRPLHSLVGIGRRRGSNRDADQDSTVSPEDVARAYPNLVEMGASANQQVDSPFFAKLPPEVRLIIYRECWAISGLTQHLLYFPDKPRVKRCAPCIIQHNRPESYMKWIHDDDASEKMQSWPHLCQVLLPTQSPWKNHWLCRESAKANRWRLPVNMFLPLLLCCKATYLECRASIAACVTFALHDRQTALSLLMYDPPPILKDVKRLQISWSFHSTELIELQRQNRAWNSEWRGFCKRLAELPKLEEASIRLHPADNWRVNHFALTRALYALPDRLKQVVTLIVPIDEDEEYEGFENPNLNLPRNRVLTPPGVRVLRHGNPRLERFGPMPNIFDEIVLQNGVVCNAMNPFYLTHTRCYDWSFARS
ncbi:hypothetical protein F5Y18DRAFT_227763 [Xylariaceae sp. FL1019]|nr:hypothetical protein F5Y18DRAFT_227763 [Xylariaceae sp. FL1019]